MPEISFFIQTYNTAPYLKECIDSILAQRDNYDYERAKTAIRPRTKLNAARLRSGLERTSQAGGQRFRQRAAVARILHVPKADFGIEVAADQRPDDAKIRAGLEIVVHEEAAVGAVGAAKPFCTALTRNGEEHASSSSKPPQLTTAAKGTGCACSAPAAR